MISFRIITCLVLLFTAGGFTGASLTRVKERRALLSAGVEEVWLQRLYDQYSAELKMTPEQIKTVQPAMDQARGQFKLAREEVLKHTRKTMNELYHKINATLTPEQQKRFAELVRERRGLKKTDGAPDL